MIYKRSRYARVTARTVGDLGPEPVVLLDPRPPSAPPASYSHVPTEGERLDHLADRYFNDPTGFHRICDSSAHLDPFDVVVPGRPVRIPPVRE